MRRRPRGDVLEASVPSYIYQMRTSAKSAHLTRIGCPSSDGIYGLTINGKAFTLCAMERCEAAICRSNHYFAHFTFCAPSTMHPIEPCVRSSRQVRNHAESSTFTRVIYSDCIVRQAPVFNSERTAYNSTIHNVSHRVMRSVKQISQMPRSEFEICSCRYNCVISRRSVS